MAGVTDKPFRLLCKELGAAYAVSEMTSSDPRLWRTRKSRLRMDHLGEPEPIGIQIAGADPAALAEAARFNVGHGAQIIDINFGCPAKKVCNAWCGSALLRDERLVGRIISAVVASAGVPVTVKIRTGWRADRRNALRVATIAEDAGAAMIAIHGRTRDMLYTGHAEYETIAQVKARSRIPVVANGDIDSPEKALHVLETTGADAIMIGRAAQGRPWIFGQIDQFLATGQAPPEPPLEQVKQILQRHLLRLYQHYGEAAGVRIARKHLGWYARDHPENAAFRAVVNAAGDARRQLHLTADYFDALIAGVPPAAQESKAG